MSATKPVRYLTRQSPGVVITQDVLPDSDEMYHTTYGNRGGESWKLDVGAECNMALEHADGILREAVAEGVAEVELVNTIRSIVARVATFEELEVEP